MIYHMIQALALIAAFGAGWAFCSYLESLI
jgi:hypothetical protein